MDFSSKTLIGEKSSHESRTHPLSLPDVSSDSLGVGTRSSTIDFMNSSDSFLGIVLRSSFLMMRESLGSSIVTPLFDVNKDECFDPGGDTDEIDAFLAIDSSMDVKDGYHDLEGDLIYLESLLTNETIPSLPSEGFLDHDIKSLKDESMIDDSKNG
nr:hypothetical protein [Tanacetum cinerariifolium]